MGTGNDRIQDVVARGCWKFGEKLLGKNAE